MKLVLNKAEIDFLAETIKSDLLSKNISLLETTDVKRLFKYDNKTILRVMLEAEDVAAKKDKEEEIECDPDDKECLKRKEEAEKEKERKRQEELLMQNTYVEVKDFSGDIDTEINRNYSVAGISPPADALGSAAGVVAGGAKSLVTGAATATITQKLMSWMDEKMSAWVTSVSAFAGSVGSGVSAAVSTAMPIIVTLTKQLLGLTLLIASIMVAIGLTKWAYKLLKWSMKGILRLFKKAAKKLHVLIHKNDAEGITKMSDQYKTKLKPAVSIARKSISVLPGNKKERVLNRITSLERKFEEA